MYTVNRGDAATFIVEFRNNGSLYTPSLVLDTDVYLPDGTLLGSYTPSVVSTGRYSITAAIPITSTLGTGRHVWSYKAISTMPVHQSTINFGVSSGVTPIPPPVYTVTVLVTQFGRIHDSVRTLFLTKLTEYFETTQVNLKYTEIPIIEKYEITNRTDGDYPSTLNIINNFPDLAQKLPMIAVTSVNGMKKSLNLGFNTAATYPHETSISGTVVGPFTGLSSGDTIVFTIGSVDYTVELFSSAFTSFTSISVSDLSTYFKQVCPMVIVSETDTGELLLRSARHETFAVKSGTALTHLGLTAGQTPDLTTAHQYIVQSEELSVFIDVLASDWNQRTEVMDLVRVLLGVYVFEEDIGQWFSDNMQVIFGDGLASRGENETPAPAGAPFSKIYSDGITVPVLAIQYLDRTQTNTSVQTVVPSTEALP